MPVTNLTVPDSSPWITYSGVWGDSDAATASYTNGTFHFTFTSNAAASITFNGTGASLYGAKRGNHGPYIVDLDGTPTTLDGHASSDLFNQTLFSSSGLTSGTHNISLTNSVAGSYTDLDWAVLEVGDGNLNTTSHDFWMDDTHPNITYAAGWSVGGVSNLIGQYYNSSFHACGSQGGSATIQFSGQQIALYGATSNNHGTFTVSLDGMPSQSYNGTQITFRPQQLLYFASNLKNGSHTVVLTNTQAELFTDLDYAVVTTYFAPGAGSAASTGGGSSSTDSGGPSTPIGAIVGGVVGGIVMIAVIALLLFLIHRQRKKNRGDTIFSQKGQDALGHELAPGVSVAAMASYGGARGPSPQRSYADGLGANPALVPGMGGHQYAPRTQQPYDTAAPAAAVDPLLGAGRGNEIDMPPPNYEHVFSQGGSSGGGSQAGGSQFGGGSQLGGSSAGGSLPVPPDPANTQVYRQLREKGVVIPPEAQMRVTRGSDL